MAFYKTVFTSGLRLASLGRPIASMQLSWGLGYEQNTTREGLIRTKHKRSFHLHQSSFYVDANLSLPH